TGAWRLAVAAVSASRVRRRTGVWFRRTCKNVGGPVTRRATSRQRARDGNPAPAQSARLERTRFGGARKKISRRQPHTHTSRGRQPDREGTNCKWKQLSNVET